MITYQVRIREGMSDRPATEVMACNIYQAYKKLEEVREEIKATWATPDPDAAYLIRHDSTGLHRINC